MTRCTKLIELYDTICYSSTRSTKCQIQKKLKKANNLPRSKSKSYVKSLSESKKSNSQNTDQKNGSSCHLSKTAKKELKKLHKSGDSAYQKITSILKNPELHLSSSKVLQGTLSRYSRFRAGDYRVIYKKDGSIYHIYKIAHRRDIYEDITMNRCKKLIEKYRILEGKVKEILIDIDDAREAVKIIKQTSTISTMDKDKKASVEQLQKGFELLLSHFDTLYKDIEKADNVDSKFKRGLENILKLYNKVGKHRKIVMKGIKDTKNIKAAIEQANSAFNSIDIYIKKMGL